MAELNEVILFALVYGQMSGIISLTLAPNCLFMHKPMSSTSDRPLCSTDHLDLFVPRVSTPLAQCCAFAVTGPSS